MMSFQTHVYQYNRCMANVTKVIMLSKTDGI
jgi:hypothetical protein